MDLLKKFIPYYKPYLGVFLLDLLCATILSVIDLAFPQLLRILRETLYLKRPEEILKGLGVLAAGLLLMYLVRAFCRYYVTYHGHMMGARMDSVATTTRMARAILELMDMFLMPLSFRPLAAAPSRRSAFSFLVAMATRS